MAAPQDLFLALLLLPVCLQVTLSPTSPAGEASAHPCKEVSSVAMEKTLHFRLVRRICNVSTGLQAASEEKPFRTFPGVRAGTNCHVQQGCARGEVQRCILGHQRAGGSIDARELVSPAGTSLRANDQVWEIKRSKTRPGTVSLLGPEVLSSSGESFRIAGLQPVQEILVLGQSHCFSRISPGLTGAGLGQCDLCASHPTPCIPQPHLCTTCTPNRPSA